MRKAILKTMLSFCFVALTITSFAQSTISGKVVDAETDETLIGASVIIDGTTNGAVSNIDGDFSFTTDKRGKQLIKVSYIGYITQEIPVTIKSGSNSLGVISLETNSVGINEVKILASFAKDRETPVSVSQINPIQIEEKLGTQEFPEILKTTPSIYTSKEGGGFGDASVYVRGFDSNNVGVLINGIPVNDMESGKVYWSNWAGLSDVAQTMQVQRGLGASKLGLSSVGGTINIITKSTDAERGGHFKTQIGNSGHRKQILAISSGLMDNGWAITMRGTHVEGDGYIQGTNFEGWSYFLSLAKRLSDRQRLSFVLFGAPQWHNQRGTKHTIETYRNNKDGIKYNSDYGIRNGQIYGGAYGYNYYHKPVMQLNHYWNITSKSLLSTSLYASLGQGGGRSVDGVHKDWLKSPGIRTPDGLLDFERVIAENKKYTTEGSQAVIVNSLNSHDWYGLLSTLTSNINNFKITGGFDGRYYKGYHYTEIDDLLGGSFYIDYRNKNINRDPNTKLYEGDKVYYDNPGEVIYAGLFGQAEYISDIYTGFLSVSIANKNYRRTDFFQYKPGDQKTDWQKFFPWSVKAGFNYNINEHHNVFVNGGYVTRTPFFKNVFLNYTNSINKDVNYEKIITTELGYGYSSSIFSLKASLYRTNWRDRAIVKSYAGEIANITGLNQLHQGVEVETTYKPNRKLTLKGMLSLGDWVYQDDVNAVIFDENQVKKGEFNAYVKDVHVGNSAQKTASLTMNYEILPNLRVGADYVYYIDHYADFDAANRGSIKDKGVDAWKLPDVGIMDMNFNYKFKVGNLDASIFGNVNNLLSTEYVSKARDGKEHDAKSVLVYYGFGRTWSTGIKVKF